MPIRFLLVALVGLQTAYAANVLNNAGFEENPAGTDVHPVSGWEWYGQSWNTLTETDPAHAHSGSQYFKVFGGFTGADNWNGLYQDVNCTPGSSFIAESWAYSLSADGGGIHGQSDFWVEVTFRDGSANPLALYRSGVVNGGNISAYGGLNTWFKLKVTNQWSFSNSGGVPVAIAITNTVANLVAPAGTAFARYQLVFHQGPDNANGSAYFDDCELNQAGATGSAWNIVWSDEFNGTEVKAANWTFETGNNNGWGNSELEYYTSRPQNVTVSNGLLHIIAQRESYGGYNYTSARMKSQGLYTKRCGRFEFRARLPAGLGYWPALWMLGANFPNVGWPACGEIDVMENKGSVLNQVQGTIHYSDAGNNHLQSTGYATLPNGDSVTNFHSYMLEWTTNAIRWYFDGRLYETQTSWSSSTGAYPAPFNQPFFLIMNLAVGGSYLGKPSEAAIDANTVFPGELQVDYVRVYDLTAPLQLSVSHANGNVVLSWPANVVCHLQAQTNAAGLSTDWVDLWGTPNPYVLSRPGGNVFYRLQSP